ncbi:MAG: ATP-binding cassette domain-containing protein, partial [Myxococcota bacterium]
LAPADRPGRLGFVAQDPGDQLVCGTVADEVAFGPECAGWAPDRVEARIPEVLAAVALGVRPDRDPRTLSTGEQQRLVTGAAIAAGARLVLLDEPLAHLDPDGAVLLLAALTRLAADGVAVVLAEHRLHLLAGFADRMVGLDGGRIVYDGPLVVPPDPQVRPRSRAVGPVVLDARGISVRRGDRVVLDAVDFALRAGDRVALLGANGVGKSTLLGRLSSRPGAVLVPQDPDLTLFSATVAAELAYGPTDRRVPAAEVRARVAAAADGLGLTGMLDRSPHALSRGERLRVAVGAAVTCRPSVLLLDEPTAGQDLDAVEAMLVAVDDALGDAALLFATHDHGLARRHATRIVRLAGGRLTDGP